MDILYYSNLCKHSQKIIQYLVKMQLTQQLSCICIDNRVRDANNNQLYVVLENGQRVATPPNLTHVPSLLCVKKNYTLITGDGIFDYLASTYGGRGGRDTYGVERNGGAAMPSAVHRQREPEAYLLSGATANANVFSEAYTSYAMSADDLAANSGSANRPLHNYVPVDHHITIHTPTEDYRPDKISETALEQAQQQRMQDMGSSTPGGMPMVAGAVPPHTLDPSSRQPPQYTQQQQQQQQPFVPQKYTPPMQPAIQRAPALQTQNPYTCSYASSQTRSTL